MSFFTSGLFWLIEGIFICLIIIGLKTWTEDRKILMPAWKWILVIIWLMCLGFTLAFTGTNLGENEAGAALKGGILFGLIVIILAAVLWRVLGFKWKIVKQE